MPAKNMPTHACFNPRSRGGSDQLSCGRCRITHVSIHAPAGGATPGPWPRPLRPGGFNPRSRGGSDPVPRRTGALPLGFQSTLPRGERLSYVVYLSLHTPFQSTLPRGERHC